MENYSALYNIKDRITSLKPLNPDNTPDEWERSALLALEDGVKEVSEIKNIDDEPYLRFMQPMITKEACLKCHKHQGYKVGDVRGGVGDYLGSIRSGNKHSGMNVPGRLAHIAL